MSYPEPTSINAADICRDGGSFILVYIDGTGAQHEVEVLVRKDENYEAIGYWPPSLKHTVKTFSLSICIQAFETRRRADIRLDDMGWQSRPFFQQLDECRILAGVMQPPAPLIDATIMLRNDLRNGVRGCNSRRLHFLCCKSLNGKVLRPQWTRVRNPPPRDFQAAYIDRKHLTKSNLNRRSRNGAD